MQPYEPSLDVGIHRTSVFNISAFAFTISGGSSVEELRPKPTGVVLR